jgi:hypothetical protein
MDLHFAQWHMQMYNVPKQLVPPQVKARSSERATSLSLAVVSSHPHGSHRRGSTEIFKVVGKHQWDIHCASRLGQGQQSYGYEKGSTESCDHLRIGKLDMCPAVTDLSYASCGTAKGIVFTLFSGSSYIVRSRIVWILSVFALYTFIHSFRSSCSYAAARRKIMSNPKGRIEEEKKNQPEE